MLLVKELNARYFSHSISEPLLHAAISTPASGVEFDYERLELLGQSGVFDCFSALVNIHR